MLDLNKEEYDALVIAMGRVREALLHSNNFGLGSTSGDRGALTTTTQITDSVTGLRYELRLQRMF